MPHSKILVGNVLDRIKELPDESVHCVVTSPPYWQLRDYGVVGQIGLEDKPAEYLARMVEVFREVRRVLRSDGVCWVNIGDSYSNDTKWGGSSGGKNYTSAEGGYQGQRVCHGKDCDPKRGDAAPGQPMQNTIGPFKPKDLVGMPWRLAFALQEDGWWLRQDIIWSKPNPMPESVTDRCTKAHEYIFLLAKSEQYFYDAEAIKEPVNGGANARGPGNKTHKGTTAYENGAGEHRTKAGLVAYAERQRAVGVGPKASSADSGTKYNESFSAAIVGLVSTRNKRSVWEIATESFSEAHFATYPTKLVEPCIKAGTSEKGCCANCGAPWERIVEQVDTGRKQKMADGWDTGDGGHGNVHRDGREAGETGKPVTESRTVGWRPTCHCDLENEFKPGDFDLIESPTGESAGEDPSLEVGRAGMERPRGENEGKRVITRFQQRAYAAQLRSSPHRAEMREEAGHTAFAHYLRSDKTGARPIPEGLLGRWIEAGWLTLIEMPVRKPYPIVPATVLDPFSGAGTTCMVASRLGRDAIGIELSEEYAEMSLRRISGDNPMFNHVELDTCKLLQI